MPNFKSPNCLLKCEWYAILQQYAKELIYTHSFLKNWKEFYSNLRIHDGIALGHNQV
jgi:hypothetical protein